MKVFVINNSKFSFINFLVSHFLGFKFLFDTPLMSTCM